MPTKQDVPPRTAARLTVNLTKKALEALNATTKLTDDTKTDVINKAVQLYHEVQEAQSQHGGIWIQSDKTGEPVLVRYS